MQGALVLLKGILIAFLMPPVSLAVLALAALLARASAMGRRVAAVSVFLLILLATPFVSRLLLATLSAGLAQLAASDLPAQAIVILGGDVAHGAAPGPIVEAGALTLERLRKGAAVARRTGLPVLVSGGPLYGEAVTLSALMAQSFVLDFSMPPPWQESRSTTTWENAAESAAFLQARGISSVYLVTHAMHMRRALLAFRHFGLTATPIPVRADPFPPFLPGLLLPTPAAWQQSYYAFHEWVGWLAYTLR